MSSLPPTVQPSPDTDVTFKYFWDFGEHVRLVRAVMRHQSGGGRWIYRLLVAATALVVVLALLGSEGHWGATIRELAPWVVLFGLWMAVFQWACRSTVRGAIAGQTRASPRNDPRRYA